MANPLSAQIRPDPYRGIINLTDLVENIRGWSTERPRIITRHTHEELVPECVLTMASPESRTLSRSQSFVGCSLRPGVQLKVVCNSTLISALNFASVFISPIPLITERTSLSSVFMINAPCVIIHFCVPYTDIQGQPTDDGFNPSTMYAVEKVTRTDVIRAKEVELEFYDDGRVVQASKASQKEIQQVHPATQTPRARELIERIEAQTPICKVSVQAGQLTDIFPRRTLKREKDRTIIISPNGVRIEGIINDKPASLNLTYSDGQASRSEWSFDLPPKENLHGKLIMMGLSKFGQIASSTAIVTLTFFGRVDDLNYLRVSIPFSQMSRGEIFLTIRPTPKTSPMASIGEPTTMSDGSEAIVPSRFDRLLEKQPESNVDTHAIAIEKKAEDVLAMPIPKETTVNYVPDFGYDDEEEDEECPSDEEEEYDEGY